MSTGRMYLLGNMSFNIWSNRNGKGKSYCHSVASGSWSILLSYLYENTQAMPPTNELPAGQAFDWPTGMDTKASFPKQPSLQQLTAISFVILTVLIDL